MLHNLSATQAAEMLFEYQMTGSFNPLARKYGISPAALHRWRRYLGLNAEWIVRVKALEHELALMRNHCEKVEQNLAIARRVIIRFQPSPRKRSVLAALLIAQFRITHSSANSIVGLSKKTGRNKSWMVKENELVGMMEGFLAENPGYGFRKLFAILLRDEPCGKGLALRLYKKFGFEIGTRKIKPKVPVRIFKPMAVQIEPNTVWSMDLMTDVLSSGKRFWVLNVLDDFNREAVVIKVLMRPTVKAVIAALDEVVNFRKPKCIRTDNGAEFKAVTYRFWAKRRHIYCEYTRFKTPTDNAYVESFNGTLRREIFNHFRFADTRSLQRMLDDWRIRYNLGRPHSALQGLSPAQFAMLMA
ncbi:IS3 family transposase [Luteimonas gilva]|uniref:IS3 family transposase n=1 Tax=Luteimonas gilva TaxID=2572684 RepID=A0A4U5JLT5_9GAMM|nr:IS3 family transposase [Luteimonas gilva]TKR30620.1 IS3 family transposase [Luteimonas gilva]